MPVTYKNFRGDLYYLHSKVTKKGNTSFHFSKKVKSAEEVEKIPEGFEIYEEPNGKVYLRKQQQRYIHEDELQLIKTGMEKYSGIKDFKLDVKKEMVYIYTVDDSLEELPFKTDLLKSMRHYDTQLRFVLVDKVARVFDVERFCYMGTVDDWIFVDGSADLEKLVKEYVHHLGEESFYELGF